MHVLLFLFLWIKLADTATKCKFHDGVCPFLFTTLSFALKAQPEWLHTQKFVECINESIKLFAEIEHIFSNVLLHSTNVIFGLFHWKEVIAKKI